MPLQTEAVWLPDSFREQQERETARAIEEYDADLMLGFRRDTGTWCAFLPGNRNSEGQPFPVFSFGEELPSPERAKEMLYKNDVRRNGRELLDQLDRIYDAEQKQLRDRASEAAERVAEVIDSNMRMNDAHPYPRVYVGRPKYGGGRVRSSG